jgi:hypothetical protein
MQANKPHKERMMRLFRKQFPGLSGANQRSGLSLLEFLGCTIALVGGAWLGAIYLGINVNHLTYTALEEADLLDSMPEKLRPAAPSGSDKLRGLSRQQLVTSLRDELVALRNEITSLRTSDQPVVASTDTGKEGSDPSAAAKAKSGLSEEKTRAYWNRLSEIALGEAALQHDAELAFTDANASKVLVVKGRVSRFAALAVEAIPREQVDPAVVQLGRQLGEWYDRGGDLYETAVEIQNFPTDNTNHERLTQQWRREDIQHRNEAQLLSNRAIAVREELRRRFGTEFPEFGQPPAEPADSEASPETEAQAEGPTED